MKIVKATMLITAMLSMFMISSCTKKESSEPANKKFIGTYNGTDCNGGVVTDIIVNAGGNDNTISLPSTMGVGTCERPTQITGTVSGNNVTFGTQTLTDLCGNSQTFSGTGTISGSTFSFTLSGTLTPAGGSSQAISACFTGSK